MDNDYKEKLVLFFQKLEICFFYFFIATATLSVRKILYMRQIRSSFNEYSSVYIYLSDIVLVCVFLLFILNNKNTILSNMKLLFTMFHVEQIRNMFAFFEENDKCSTWNIVNYLKKNIVPHGTIILRKTYTQVVNKYWIIFPLVAVFFSFLSILWTTYPEIAFFRSIKLAEFVTLYFYVIDIVPRGTKVLKHELFHVKQFNEVNGIELNEIKSNNCSTWNKLLYRFNIVPRGTILKNGLSVIVLVAFVQSIIGILQFILKSSIGLFWLKESIISINTPGVAKVLLNGNIYVRAYGLFPHPNILGGYLVFSIITTLFLLKLFHVEQTINESQCEKSVSSNCSTWNNLRKLMSRKIQFKDIIVPRETFILKLILLIQILALVLTFSKSALFGLIMGLFYISIYNIGKNVPRGTNSLLLAANKFADLFHVEQAKRKILIALILIFAVFVFLKPDLNSLFIKTLNEREFFINVSRGTIGSHFFGGVGAGQFIFEIENIVNAQDWQFQPVHNVFLLIWSEYGVFFLVAFVLFLWHVFNKCSTWNIYKEGSNHQRLDLDHYLRAVLLAYIFIMLFDHYLWDIQQGSFMLWILLSFIVSKKGEHILTN